MVRHLDPHRHTISGSSEGSSEGLSSSGSDGSSTPVSGTDDSGGTDMPDPNDRFLGLGASGGLPAPVRGGGPNPAGDLLVVIDMAEDAATERGVA